MLQKQQEIERKKAEELAERKRKQEVQEEKSKLQQMDMIREEEEYNQIMKKAETKLQKQMDKENFGADNMFRNEDDPILAGISADQLEATDSMENRYSVQADSFDALLQLDTNLA